MKIAIQILALACLACAVQAQEAAESQPAPQEQDFDLPGEELSSIKTDTGLDLGEVDFVGNPAKGLFSWWPEDLVVAPVPGYSSQLGWSLTLGGGYFIEPKKAGSDSPPSIIGGFVMSSDNGSYAYGAGANLHLYDDKLRVKFGAAYFDIRYKFYGIGNDWADLDIGLDLEQNGPGYFGSASWRVWRKLYVGLGILNGQVESRLRLTLPDVELPELPPLFDPPVDVGIGAFTIPIEYDSRDHEQFPRNGVLIKARASLYRESAGSDFESNIFKLSANHYLPMRDRDVLASRVVLRRAGDDTPFFLLSTVGGSTDLRGYPSGRYRDRYMYAMQTEYRWQASERWILTGFVGVGEVASEVSDFGDNLLPATGIGARFVLSQKHRVGLSADIAWGNEGSEFYFGVGEAF